MSDRIAQLQESMAADGVDAVVLRLAENVLLATGWYVQIPGLGLAVVPREGDATLLVPEYEVDEATDIWQGPKETFPAIRNDGPTPGAAIEKILRQLAGDHG